MKYSMISLFAGLLFAVGLTISGMVRPSRVQGFLDITGQWDYSLAFVMIGGIAIHFLAYQWKNRLSAPLVAPKFHIPDKTTIDKKLILGAALFGIGWGLVGYCPGPALTSVGGSVGGPLIFVGAMTLGMQLERLTRALMNKKS